MMYSRVCDIIIAICIGILISCLCMPVELLYKVETLIGLLLVSVFFIQEGME